MSTNENIQIVEKAYADFLHGDVAAMLAAMDESVEWVTPEVDLPTGGTWKGKAGVGEFFQKVAETWDFQAFAPKEYIASGEQVAVRGSYTARARSTGRAVSCEWCMTWKIRAGKVLHFQEYSDTAVLRDAVTARAAA